MKISKPEIVQENKQITCQVSVEYAKGTKTLWYRLNDEYGNLLSDSSDAFLVGLLIPAMALGEDIHIKGKISDRLLLTFPDLCKDYCKILSRHLI